MNVDSQFEPTWIAEIELDAGRFIPRGVMGELEGAHSQTRLWVRVHGEPVGYVEYPSDTDPTMVAEQIAAELGPRITQHYGEDGIDLPCCWSTFRDSPNSECTQLKNLSHPRFAVVVATKNRTSQLARTLDSLGRVRYKDFEVLIIDSSSDDQTKELVGAYSQGTTRMRYFHDGTAGLSKARNIGMRLADSDFIAFTDDDCEVDPGWLWGLARGFARGSDITCVTGITPSGRLDTYPQKYFDRRVWWSEATQPKIYSRHRQPDDSPLHPFKMGIYGTGANFAVKKDSAVRLGGFSELLGAGSPCRGGAEDGDMFVRLLRADGRIAFEPSAIVWHEGRRSVEDLESQLRAYGRGIPVTALKWLSDPHTRSDVIRRLPRASLYYGSLLWRRGYGGEGGRAASLASAELVGALTGTADFVRGWRESKRAYR